MHSDFITKYDLRVPRYTSYPTAPHFSEAVGNGEYSTWLKELPPQLPLSLYLHIAYCSEMCWFCGCNTKITRRYQPVKDYLDCLWQEIDMVADCLAPKMSVSHIHFGGGSPNIVKPDDFIATIEKLKSRFAIMEQAEIAVELDPRTTDMNYIRTIAESGVTRASVGVQDFNPLVQSAINRVQPYNVTRQVIEWLRHYGISKINLDLVYGLPHQSVSSVMETIELTIGFAPDRIALFGYAHVPWMKKHQRLIPDDALPDIGERWHQYEAAARILAAHNYIQIGLDHFAKESDELSIAMKDGRLHRNFQGYTADNATTLVGLGVSGISSLPQGYAANNNSVHNYKKSIQNGQLAINRGIAVTEDDLLRRTIIERLMCDLAIDLDEMGQKIGFDPTIFDDDLEKMTPMIADGLIHRNGRKIRMSEIGRPLVRAACTAFDRYLKPDNKSHSIAV